MIDRETILRLLKRGVITKKESSRLLAKLDARPSTSDGINHGQ
jgi:hypothetical protein